MEQTQISVIIINFRSDQYLEKCIASLYNFEKNSLFEIILVNNDQSEKIGKISEFFPKVKIIQTQENLGFGKAANLGAKEAQGKILFFLNPDTEIQTELFAKILEEFEKNTQTAIIGPQIKEKNGENQRWTFGEKLNLWRLFLNNLNLGLEKNYQTKKFVDWVSGAGMFVKKEIFSKIGGFDEKFFMYFEDLDLCWRTQKTGKKIVYLPEVKIIHLGSGSTMADKERKKIYYASQDYYFQKHFGKFQLGIIRALRRMFG